MKPTWKEERNHPLNTFMTSNERPEYKEDYTWIHGARDTMTQRDKRLLSLGQDRKHSL